MAKTSKKTSSFSSDSQTMEELLAQSQSLPKNVSRNQVVEGTILSISPNELIVDIGAKAEAIVPKKELSGVSEILAQLKVGDKVSGMVISINDEGGRIELSLKKTGLDKKWEVLREKQEKGEVLEAVVMESNKGGLLVDVLGVRGFIPSSQLQAENLSQIHSLSGKILKVKILEQDKDQNRLIVSEKLAWEEENKIKASQILKKIKVGDQVEGIVTAVLPFGIFVNISGVEGLIHVSEISWEKVYNPSQLFKVGDKISALVLEVEKETGKINLSLKQLLSDPWTKIGDKLSVGEKVSGTISKVVPFGVFVKLDELGMDGLIHVSKIPTGKDFNIGDKIFCLIESIDSVKRRIGLALQS